MRYFDFGAGLHRNYAAGRTLSPEVVRLWRTEIAALVGDRTIDRVMDLGAGTGRFSGLLGSVFGAEVVAVDPSQEMLAQAPGHVRRVVGRAEALPLAAGSCDLIFASMVLHHLSDLEAAAVEIERVRRAGAPFVVRTAFADTLHTPYHRFFPAVLDFERRVVPSRNEVIEAFGSAGLRWTAARTVRQKLDDDHAAYADRIRLRAMSPFRMISDEEFEAGMRRLDDFAAAETEPSGVFEDVDLVLFA